MAEPVKFTVVIPTRERADTLYHTLRTVVAQRYDNLAILVSDNFSADNTRAVVDSFDDPRITYVNTGRRVSMSHNWEFALSHVTEGWITFLGDDDGLLPGALQRVAQVIEATRARAVMSRWRFYFWPGSTAEENRLTVPCGTGWELRDSRAWLGKLMQGQTDYHELPYVYTGGFADVELLNAARNSEGQYFCSMTPDVYSAIAIASTLDSYVMLHEPTCVMGVSSHSNGASNFGNGSAKAAGDLFFSESNIPFHPMLGQARVKSIEIVVYEAYLQSLHLHHDAHAVLLGDQMRLALEKAAPADYDDLRVYCRAVAAKNGIPESAFPHPGQAGPRRLARTLLAKAKLLRRAMNDLTVDAASYGVKDVHAAALLCSHLWQFHQADRHWRVKLLWSLLRRRLLAWRPHA